MLKSSAHYAHTRTVDQLHEAFRSVLDRICQKYPECNRFGLAISGGVDSMALATLCSQLAADRDPSISFQAFVVDHVARESSAKEARFVAARLRAETLNIPARVLKLQWDTSRHPALLPNFESKARHLRFRALGEACREAEIDLLMLGHHADDQAETVLSRLLNGYTGIGLRGIKADADIPECDGMYGPHRSGAGRTADELRDESQGLSPSRPSPFIYEEGGVRICRPLLSFHKSELRAICKAHGTPWVEDETNKDPILTIRNTIRSLLTRDVLPKAISKPALLNIASRVATREELASNAVRRALQYCAVDLNPRSGRVELSIPADLDELFVEKPSEQARGINRQYIAAALVRHIILLVSPQHYVQLDDVESAVRCLFQSSFEVGAALDRKSRDPAQTCNVNFQLQGQQESLTDDTRQSPKAVTSGDLNAVEEHGQDESHVAVSHQPRVVSSSSTTSWMISRAIPSQWERKHAETRIGEPQQDPSFMRFIRWTPWVLFDGRYWLRLKYRPINLAPNHTLSVRFLEPRDLTQIRSTINDKRSLQKLEAALTAHAPGKLRFTLPVIIESYNVPDGRKGLRRVEEVMALPSLGWSGRGWQSAQDLSQQEGWKWEIHYKKIDLTGVQSHKA